MKKLKYLVAACLSAFTSCDAQKSTPQNQELAKAAKEGKVFEGKRYYIITENAEIIRIEGKDTIRKIIQRGAVFVRHKENGLAGYSSITLTNDTNKWNLEQENANSERRYIEQYTNTPFPVIGVVQKNTTLGYYDFEAKTQKEMTLKKGTPYIWVIKKDGHYVNVLDKNGKNRTGYLDEEKLKLVQKEDHLKIMSEAKRKSLQKLWE